MIQIKTLSKHKEHLRLKLFMELEWRGEGRNKKDILYKMCGFPGA
jgi:hypothetical protein